MTHDEKIKHLIEDLRRKDIKKGMVMPINYLLLWKLGFKIKPPHFSNFFSVAIIMGSWIAVICGPVSWLLIWRHNAVPIFNIILSSLFIGTGVGIVMAFCYYRQKRKFKLPPWEDYPGIN